MYKNFYTISWKYKNIIWFLDKNKSTFQFLYIIVNNYILKLYNLDFYNFTTFLIKNNVIYYNYFYIDKDGYSKIFKN